MLTNLKNNYFFILFKLFKENFSNSFILKSIFLNHLIDSKDNFENSEPIKINTDKAKQVFSEINKTDTISSTFELYINLLFDGSNIKYNSN